MKPITIQAKNINVKPSKKIKVLWYSDFLCNTGFGTVAHELVKRLNKTGKYEFIVQGINHYGNPYNVKTSQYYDLKDIPVHPANDSESLFGYQKFATLLSEIEPDLLFVLQDHFNLMPLQDCLEKARKHIKFKYIFYFPVDGMLKKIWVDKAISLADYPVAYSKFGKEQVSSLADLPNLKIIPHGVNLDVFKPVFNEDQKEAFRKEYFGAKLPEKAFLIGNINRNQPRKDIPRTILAFSIFKRLHPEIPAYLYLHMNIKDRAGHNLHDFIQHNVPENLWDYFLFPNEEVFGNHKMPKETLVKVYNALDVLVSTSWGEGWGLSTTEAMACKIPVIVPRNTVNPELIGDSEQRGYLTECGNEFITPIYDNNLIRPLTDVKDLIKKLYTVYKKREEAKEKAEVAYKWIQDYSWDIIAKQWEELFDRAYKDLQLEITK